MHAPLRPPAPGAPSQTDPAVSASAAGLTYVSDQAPGIRRKGTGPKSFLYLDPRGRPLREEQALSRAKVLALVVRLLEVTLIRVGNEEYSRQNSSFGLTTLRDRHVKVSGGKAVFRFRGKAGKEHKVALGDAWLARLIKRCLEELEPFNTAKQAKQNVLRAIERVAERLGNTPSICRRCYVHSAVIDSYLEGSLLHTLKQKVERELRALGELPREEAVVVSLLTRRLAHEAQRSAADKADRRRTARPRASAA